MVTISKGILSGLNLRELTEADLRKLSQSGDPAELVRASFYKGAIERATFRGVTFEECSFARATFTNVNFSRCIFHRVDLTKTALKNCFFSDTTFVDCDPYNATFWRTEISPSSFKRCIRGTRADRELNKALILYSTLRRSLREMGETRLSKAADYYFRVWQRKRLYHRWHLTRISGFGPWIWSLCLGALTGYGERPVYLAGWAFAVITGLSMIYMEWIPSALDIAHRHFGDYWYYSFRVFFAQGLSNAYQSPVLSTLQAAEFLSGLVMVSLLIGSVVRKLSP